LQENEHRKEIMGEKGKSHITDIRERKRLHRYGHVKSMPEERFPKLITYWVLRGRRKRGCPKKNVDGRSTSSHDKKLRT